MKIVFTFLFVFSVRTFAAPILVSETVGSAGEDVLTSRGMVISFVVENAMNKKNRNLPESKEAKIQAVNTYLLDTMVNFEAQSLGFKDINNDELMALSDQVGKSLVDPNLKSFKFQKSEVHRVVEQKLIVKNFLKSKSKSFESLLSEADLQAYYDKNRLRFGSVPMADLKENIRAFLLQQQRDDRLKAWIEVLKKKYKARNYLIEHQLAPEVSPFPSAVKPHG